MRKTYLILGDITVLYLSLLLSIFLRYGWKLDTYTITIHIVPFSIIFALWILVFYISNLYEFSLTKNNPEFYAGLTYTFIANALIAISFFYFVPLFGIFRITPKTNLFIFLGVGSASFTLWRYYFNNLITKSGLKNNTLIILLPQEPITLNEQSQELYTFLKHNPQIGYNIVNEIMRFDTYSDLTSLENIIKEHDIKTIVLSPSVYKIPKIINVLYRLLRNKIQVFNLSAFFERVTGKIALEAIDQTWFLENLSTHDKRVFEFIKRSTDFIGALLMGLASLLTFPFIIIITLLSSEGPIFIRQERVGRGGKIFTLIKFRTMIQTAEKNGPQWAIENDNRVTKIGKILRRTRLDELPQLWNVLKGDMSFIGPRPERPEFHEQLKAAIPFYEERYLVKPGLTGWAQVKYKLDFKGSMTINDSSEKVRHDLYYIKNRSLSLDLGIILKTINIILKKLVR